MSNTVYFFNGNLFGIRGGQHRNIVLNNFVIGSNTITFQDKTCETFHGGLTDLKYISREVLHTCHRLGEEHEPCLVDRLYIGLCEIKCEEIKAFYFKPSQTKLAFERSPVDINTLNGILPWLCKDAGVARKTSHCLHVTFA